MNTYKHLEEKGKLLSTGGKFVFFGDDSFTLRDLTGLDPYYTIHQVHGNEIIRCQSSSPKADALWTDHRKQILIIKTADCLPVFIADDRKIMGVHMGWRGFTNGIFDKAIKFFKDARRINIYVGPHIGFNSFQVDSNIATRILKANALNLKAGLKSGIVKPSIDKKNHWYFDLCAILKLRSQKHRVKNFTEFSIDTFTSPRHFSHRRNRWRQGTNYSFIVKS